MHRWIAIGVVVLTLTLLTHGFSNGQLPIDACGSGPRHGNAEESPPPITIQVSHQDGTQSTTYTPGEILTGWLAQILLLIFFNMIILVATMSTADSNFHSLLMSEFSIYLGYKFPL